MGVILTVTSPGMILHLADLKIFKNLCLVGWFLGMLKPVGGWMRCLWETTRKETTTRKKTKRLNKQTTRIYLLKTLSFSKGDVNRWMYKIHTYCWWLKSRTTWDVWNPINTWINYLSTGAGFQPSTVSHIYRPQRQKKPPHFFFLGQKKSHDPSHPSNGGNRPRIFLKHLSHEKKPYESIDIRLYWLF